MRVAFIGAGNMAGHHLQALTRVPTPHVVVGVQDVQAHAAQAFAGRAGAQTQAFTAVSDLLEQTRPDLVHVCTPAGKHFEAARQALQAGAHVYVEKPFVETPEEAEALFGLARAGRGGGLLICAGHQLLRDPAYQQLMRKAATLEPVTVVDSWFSFRPPRLDPQRAPAAALSRQLLDVLPHPLYVLVAALERCGSQQTSIEISHVTATPTDLYALLRRGDVTGRLAVSLRARPVASTLTMAGANGSRTVDFVRSILLGAANEGTSPIEKIANPFVEAAQLTWRNATSLIRRVTRGVEYPGLAELLGDFYAAAAARGRSPVSVDHLRRVTMVYEQLAATVRTAITGPPMPSPLSMTSTNGPRPLAVVTGAGGFFGRAISRELTRRGFRVRGLGRSERPDDPHVHEWCRVDLAKEIEPGILTGAKVIVHAAAETAGGFDAHERNSVGATRELLRAMTAAGIRRLIHISSISVLRPPRPFWERQAEHTALAQDAEQLGPYTWGKCAAEELVARAHARGHIEARIIRPAALIDWEHLELPGLMGRRLFGRWHLGLGRPGLPFAVCDVATAATVVAWSAQDFDKAPPVLNLLDPAIATRAQLLERFREHGWHGRMLWTPISLLAGAALTARYMMGLIRRERPRPLAIWSLLRSRRYDPALARQILVAARDKTASAHPAKPAITMPTVSRAYG